LPYLCSIFARYSKTTFPPVVVLENAGQAIKHSFTHLKLSLTMKHFFEKSKTPGQTEKNDATPASENPVFLTVHQFYIIWCAVDKQNYA
jgi:hypothetical protein